jgi:DNA-binding SARP family transcriptional activator
MVVRISLFGEFRAVIGTDNIAPRLGSKTASLLALLALRPGRTYNRQELGLLLWPQCDYETGRRNLRQLLHALRSALREVTDLPILLLSEDDVWLNPESVDTDLERFERSLALAETAHEDEARLGHLLVAVEIYGGELLPGFYLEPIVQEQHRLSAEYVDALQRATLLLEQAGRYGEAIDRAQLALAGDPFSEELHCMLMRLYAHAGMPVQVSRQFEDLKRGLREELGVRPSRDTVLLARQLYDAARRAALERAQHRTAQLNSDDAVVSEREPADAQRLTSPGDRQPQTASLAKVRPSWRLTWISVLTLVVGGLWLLDASLNRRSGRNVPHVVAEFCTTSAVAARPVTLSILPSLPGDFAQMPTSVQVSTDGSLYVCGFVEMPGRPDDYFLARLHADGALWWQVRRHCTIGMFAADPLIAVAQGNRVILCGECPDGAQPLDHAAIRTSVFDGAGHLVWEKTYRSIGTIAFARGLGVDAAGNVYVAGGSVVAGTEGRGANQDYLLIKYSPDGRQLNVASYDGPTHQDDVALAMALDRDGTAWLTGRSMGRDTSFDFATVQFSPSGKREWAHRYDGHAHGEDQPAAIVAGAERHVSVVGTATAATDPSLGPLRALVTLEYDERGYEIWRRADGGYRGADSVGDAVAMDREGNVYACGDTGDAQRRLLLLKYNAAGVLQWKRTIFGPQDLSVGGRSVMVDPQGYIVVSGHLRRLPKQHGPVFDEPILARFHPDGRLDWLRSFDAQSHLSDHVCLTLDSAGRCVLAVCSEKGPVQHTVVATLAP